MANYEFWALGEASVTVSGGVSLDGITQGDGSHLVGNTVTLLTNNWELISVRDNGASDFSFADNDGGQRLDGQQTFDGITYNDNTRIEAEYRFTMLDQTTGKVYQAVTVNLRNSNPSYATNEGIAFIDEFPPVGRPLLVTAAREGPSNSGANALPQQTIAVPPCFTPGTFVETNRGPIRVERLKVGDQVLTRDRGFQPLTWVGHCDIAADALLEQPHLFPIRISKDAFGAGRPNRDMHVSPQHRVLVEGALAQLTTGEDEALAAAVHLVGIPGVTIVKDVDWITYIHLQCAYHEVLISDGLPTESFNPGPVSMASFDAEAKAELQALFPDRDLEHVEALPAARPLLKKHEAKLVCDQWAA